MPDDVKETYFSELFILENPEPQKNNLDFNTPFNISSNQGVSHDINNDL
jgi:hypothetical protein